MAATDATTAAPGTQAARPKLGRPPFYRVIMLNDDFTPMDFVVELLMRIYHHAEPEAVALMLKVHHEGQAIVGVYPREIAETKVEHTHRASRAAGHPLRCLMEPEETDDE